MCLNQVNAKVVCCSFMLHLLQYKIIMQQLLQHNATWKDIIRNSLFLFVFVRLDILSIDLFL